MDYSWKRLLAFLLLFGGMYAVLAQAWSAGMANWLIDDVTVQPAAWLSRLVCADDSIVADGSHLRSARGSLNVLFGCEGMDVLLVLGAAVLVTPVGWGDRLVGLLAGVVVVFAVNQLRLLALFLSIRSEPGWFGALHGLVAPLFVVALVAAYFVGWLNWSRRAEFRGVAAN
jgi:exosortase family protein XrtM